MTVYFTTVLLTFNPSLFNVLNCGLSVHIKIKLNWIELKTYVYDNDGASATDAAILEI